MDTNFQEFLEITQRTPGIRLVGYDRSTGKEIQIPISNIASQGEPGKSAAMEFSANGSDSWHYPAIDTDKYVRFRLGMDNWSLAFKIVADESEGGGSYEPSEPGKDGREVRLSVVNGSIAWQYVGEDGWRTLVALSDLEGAPGIPGAQGMPGRDLVHTVERFEVHDTFPEMVRVETSKLMVNHIDSEFVLLDISRDWDNPIDLDITMFNETGNEARYIFYVQEAYSIETGGEVEFYLRPHEIVCVKIVTHVSIHGEKFFKLLEMT